MKRYWKLTKRQLCDVECLLTGVFAPLTGFLNQENYRTVCEQMRLSSGALWSMPITLDVSESFATESKLDEDILLLDEENTPIAVLTISDIWMPDKRLEAELVFSTVDCNHPGVDYLFNQSGDWYIGGELQALTYPKHYDFLGYRHTPSELKRLFQLYGWSRVVAFQTRNPIHRAHFELTERAAKKAKANLLLHPVVGMTKPQDIEYRLRVKAYQQVLKYYQQPVLLSLLPLAMRMAGPREALWHAMIRKNYGATHFIVGRDHAGPGMNQNGIPFYEAYAAQHLVQQFADEIEIEVISSQEIVYVKEKHAFLSADEVTQGDTVMQISGTVFRNALINRTPLPDWFSFPEVIQVLQQAFPPKSAQGFTLFFTGLSGAGKSTLAKAIEAKLLALTERSITLLDGDVVRRHLSSELGFSKKDRNINIERIGYVASEITKHGGIAICAAIAPYASARQAARTLVSQYGAFIEIYVSTALDICEARDVKGLYLQAKQGLIKDFTGVDSPYEKPQHPELIIDTKCVSIVEAVDCILNYLKENGYLVNVLESAQVPINSEVMFHTD